MDRGNAKAALERLATMSSRLSEMRDLEAAMREILDTALDLLGAETGRLRWLDDTPGEPERFVERGVQPDPMEAIALIGADGRVLGALAVDGRPPASLGDVERLSLDLLAHQAISVVERLRAAARVDASARRYQTLFESIDQAFAVVEVVFDDAGAPVDYRFLETNPVYRRHTGHDDPVGKTARELVPELEQEWIETFGRVVRTGEPERFTRLVETIDRWLDGYAFPFGPPAGRQVAVFFRDVTEQRTAELRDRFLVALDDETRGLVEPEAIATTACRLLVGHLVVDRAFYVEIDEDADEVAVIGEWSPVLPSVLGRYRFADYSDALRATLRTGGAFVVNDRESSGLTAQQRSRYGHHRVAAVVQVPVFEDGRLRASLAVSQATARRWRDHEVELLRAVASRCREAIERARVAERLRESEDRFRTLTELLPQFIWIAGPDGHIEWFNEYAHRFFGPEKDIFGLGWMRFHDPELIGEIERGYLEAIAAGTPYSCTTRFMNAAGEYRWFIARMLPQHDPQGRVLRFIGYNIDVTDLYDTQARLVEADRRKDEFLATLAHELRNPLAPLSNMLEILKLQPRPSINRELREVMQRQVHHLGRLVDDLLDASRITRGVIELQREPVLLGEVLGGAIETSRPLLEARRHRLQVDAPEEQIWLDADAVRLTQVFANLLNNAAKYTDENGCIGIRVSVEDGRAVVAVTDDGIGIARDMLGRVFELFTQVDRHSGRAQGGLGIGLSLSRRLVEMHGGTLTAESEGVGRGSRFTVRLPRETSRRLAVAERPAAPEPPPKTRFPLLVVDDNVDAADSLGHLLRSLGGDVEVVYDGVAALAAMERTRFAAAFIDLGMPVLDGLELARRIRADSRFAGIRLVAVTGWGQDEDRERSRRAGFDRHLVKPAELDALQAILAELAAAAADNRAQG